MAPAESRTVAARSAVWPGMSVPSTGVRISMRAGALTRGFGGSTVGGPPGAGDGLTAAVVVGSGLRTVLSGRSDAVSACPAAESTLGTVVLSAVVEDATRRWMG